MILKLDKVTECQIKNLIIQRATDIAINLTELECNHDNIYCYKELNNKILTDEAKVVFDCYYQDEYNSQLELVKNVINIINESKYSG
jgi:hypothetical protein